jgi:wobble nucleotide-excising tRNase
MLESIFIRNVATYDETGVRVEELKKINFIYGVNGSGKTTLTKFINGPQEPLFETCALNWRGGVPLKTLVYNKDFRDANFGKGKIAGIFTLGSATKEQIEKIDRMKVSLDEIKEEGIQKKKSLETVSTLKVQHEEIFKENCWLDLYKSHEDDFKEAFAGVMKKESFKAKVLQEYGQYYGPVLSLAILKEKAATIFGDPPTTQPLLSTLDSTRISEIESEAVWQKKIIGKLDVDIASLIQKMNLGDWVNEGRNYLQDDKTCPFCQKATIDSEFRKQLESYFDDAFTSDSNKVKELKNEYESLSATLSNLLAEIEEKERTNVNSKLNKEKYSALVKTLASQFLANRTILENKTKEPSRSFELTSTSGVLDEIQSLIEETNVALRTHNAIVDNYANERAILIGEIWEYLISENEEKIRAFTRKNDGFQRGIDALARQREKLVIDWRDLNKKIQEENRNVTSVQPSIDEINRTLKAYGFTNFEIIPSKEEKNFYQILREDGTVAEHTLSEGEVTFITFLYFLQLAKGGTKEDNVSEDRILVIDDPISSLDSNVLFVVSSLLKEIIKAVKNDQGNIKQLILLTHNVYFHKEVSFVDGRTPENGDTHYWILRRKANVTNVEHFGMKNPIRTSYELLWNELKNTSNSGITVQNIMRRIIENYFKLLGKYGDDVLIGKFPAGPEQEICRSLICWINDGSHGIPDDVFVEHQELTIEKYNEVFKSIFTLMGHSEHYNMMMGVNAA